MCSARASFISFRQSLTAFSRDFSRVMSLSLRKRVSAAKAESDNLIPVPSFEAHNVKEFKSWLMVVRNRRQFEALPASVNFLLFVSGELAITSLGRIWNFCPRDISREQMSKEKIKIRTSEPAKRESLFRRPN
jgi:hypothetical protein